MLKGNKGEWSELYVFLKLLADGKLYAADEKLNRNPDIYYPIIKILRKELQKKLEYSREGKIVLINGSTQDQLEVDIQSFKRNADKLYKRISTFSGRSTFECPSIVPFLSSIHFSSLKAAVKDKADIRIVVHDLVTGTQPTLGFSIKSMLGQASTLFNPGHTTNIIYKVKGKKINQKLISKINSISDKPKIPLRIKELGALGYYLDFYAMESQTFQLNLQLVDTDLPRILAYTLLYKYTENVDGSLVSLLDVINQKNPLSFDTSQGHPFYEYKIKSFLTDVALGMTPSKVWLGQYDATGGIIIVKKDGDIVCYHIYNRNEFENYLINNTKLEQASTSRYGFGNLYTANGQVFIKLNLQIRFLS